MQSKVLQLDSTDNILTASTDLRQGERVEFSGRTYTLTSDVPAKHKFSIAALDAGGDVIMYGVLVGKALKPIAVGERLGTDNVTQRGLPFDSHHSEYKWHPPEVSRWKGRTFSGFHRSDGQVGTRNHWLVVPLVFCENRNIGALRQAFEEELGFGRPLAFRKQVARLATLYREGKTAESKAAELASHSNGHSPGRLFENVDGIKFLTHEGGCGGTREDSNNLCGLIAGYLNHPNVAGATILSLGCQHAQVGILRDEIQARNPRFDKPLFILEQQRAGSEFNMLSEAVRKTFLGLIAANRARRAPADLSHLCLGLKCGGSDGFSGLSANPAVGHTSDLLVALGGRALLSEFPELYGVERELINRSVSTEVSERFAQLMRDYRARAEALGSGFETKPSLENIRDGIITGAMKSAGSARKGGNSPVTAVLNYPEYSTHPGLHLQCTSGNDVECVSAQAGAGANMVLFTTGLGTPVGNPIVPVVKISATSDLARRTSDTIDIDTGGVLTGDLTIEKMGEEILEQIITIANGEVKTKAEVNGQNDFIPWKQGVSL